MIATVNDGILYILQLRTCRSSSRLIYYLKIFINSIFSVLLRNKRSGLAFT